MQDQRIRQGEVALMGVVIEGSILKVQQKTLKEAERTNELLEALLTEVKHANELTRWQIEQQKVPV